MHFALYHRGPLTGWEQELKDGTFRGYLVRREAWLIAGHTLQLIWPADMDALLDRPQTHERFKQDEYMPYWAQPWPSSALLAEAVFHGPAGNGRPAIEIGCGVGVVSIAAALMGWAVTASDYDEDATFFARYNAHLNHVELAGSICLDYRIPLDEPRFDLILGSDLLYERNKCEPVARWVASALRPGGEAWLSDPNRSAADGFEDWARSFGLDPVMERVETTAPAGLLTRGRIWRVRHAGDL
jgi:predicted nicotinamide N-methyase